LVTAPFWPRFAQQSSGSHDLILSLAPGLAAGIFGAPRAVSRVAKGAMPDDLLSLRAMVVSHADGLRDLFRSAAPLAIIPTEIVDCGGDADVGPLAAGGADLCYLDGALSEECAARVVGDLRAAAQPPFIAILATEGTVPPSEADGVAGKPAIVEEAKWLLDRSLRIRLTTRVLVVDDSATIRSIVKKTLMATRFAFDVGEAADGADAWRRVRDEYFDVVFLDQNMPQARGIECLARIKQLRPDMTAIVMTSSPDGSLAADARALGAAFLRKPFFPADIENVLCGFYGLRALNPRRI
jgi:CheY-like chemotaxis protein